MRTGLWFLIALAACRGQRVEVAEAHFDPSSGATLTEDSPSVSIIALDEEPLICWSTDGTEPEWQDADCANPLAPGERTIPIPNCGFNTVNIVWADGAQRDSANYQVENDACAEGCDPVVPWSNDELARAFAIWQDDAKCLMNGCSNPGGTGNWDAACEGGGTVDWNVSLNGLRAISEFTFTGCTQTVTISVHDYDSDPDGTNPLAVIERDITLTGSGVITQDTDFGGNGNEAGSIAMTGDFTGEVISRIVIVDKARGGGDFGVSCTADAFDREDCAPGSALIAYDYPDWACHGDICPKAAPGECEAVDTDADGIADEDDNCPEVANTDQRDSDQDGIGNECDDDPGFMLIQFKTGDRCLTLGTTDAVESTTVCAPDDPSQQWLLFEDGDKHGFRSLGNDECMSQRGGFIGPWTVNTEPCDGSDEQRWSLEPYDQGGLDAAHPIRLHNAADDFCQYTDFTGNVFGTIANCGLAGTDSGRKVGLYWGGDFEDDPYAP